MYMSLPCCVHIPSLLCICPLLAANMSLPCSVHVPSLLSTAPLLALYKSVMCYIHIPTLHLFDVYTTTTLLCTLRHLKAYKSVYTITCCVHSKGGGGQMCSKEGIGTLQRRDMYAARQGHVCLKKGLLKGGRGK